MNNHLMRAMAGLIFGFGLAACTPPDAGTAPTPTPSAPSLDLTSHDALSLRRLLTTGEISAASVALVDHRAPGDAHLVDRLRAAGAVILGKANMSEWANFRSTRPTSGWSSLGGQTRNPHVLDRNPCGSSSGSAVAVAALLLEAMAGQDEADPASRAFPAGTRLVPDPAGTSLAGVRLGVLREFTGSGEDPGVEAVFSSGLEQLQVLGATLVDPVTLGLDETVGAAEFTVLLTEFKAALNAYLESHDVPADRDTLTELLVWNEQHADTAMPIFGQEIFQAAEATIGLALQEPKIIQIAYAFEQASAARLEPAYLPTLER